MNVKSMKKGFTLTELIIVIVIIGILAGVLIPTFINVVNKANKAADISLIRNLNEALTLDKYDKGEHKNMTQALEATEEYGYLVDKISAKSSKNKILWDSKNDVFCYLEGNKLEYYPQSVKSGEEIHPEDDSENYLLWIIDDEVNPKFSTYLYGYTVTTDEEHPLTVNGRGLDTGKCDVAFVKYVNSNTGDNKKVVIRTNSASTTLIIDDESVGSIEHYDSVGALNIIQCHTGSYHENGKVAYVEISKGRIVLESGSKVEEIHINKKNESTFDTVIIANNGGKEELPEVITRDAVTVESETLVVKVESNGSSESVYVYADNDTGEKGSTEKVTEGDNKQNENVNSELGQKVLDNGSNADKAQTEQEQKDAKKEVVDTAIEKENYKGDIYILQNGAAPDSGRYVTLAEFRDEVNGLNGKEAKTFAGYTITLQVNIDLGGVEWTPIGTSENPFSGFFDGNNKTISKLKITTDRKYNGLFGYVVSDTYADLTGIYNEQNYTFDSSKYASNLYGASVADLTISNFEIKNTAQKYCAAVIGYAECVHMSNIQVKNGTVTGFKGVAGIVAEYNNAAIINCTTGYIQKDDTNEADVTIDASDYQVAGITAGYTHYTTTPALKGDSVIVGCNNYATIKKHDALTGYEAGIVSYWQAGDLGSTYISGCHNYGLIVSDNTTRDGTYDGAYHVSGIGNGTCLEVILDCSNEGSFSCVGDQSHVNGIAGNINTGKKVVNCSNHADITATLAPEGSINGIYTKGDNNTSFGNVNYGTLTNTNGSKYDISDGIQSLKITSADLDSNQTIENLNAVILAKYELNTSYTSISMMDLDLDDKTGELSIPEGIKTIHANTVVCRTINTPESLKTVTMKGIEYTYSTNIPNKLIFNGDDNTITINSGVAIDSIALSGNNNSVVINGSVGTISILGNGTGLDITNNENANLGHLSIVGSTAEVTLTNYGTMNGATGHVIGVEAACKLTINLYGSITASSGFAILLYDGCVGEINAYAGSTVTGGFAPYRGNGRTTILYQDGASIDGKSWTTQKSTEHHVTVAEMN